MFWVNVPIGIVAAITASMVLPAATATGTGRLHLPAVLLASLGLTLVLYPLIAASGHTQWPSWTYPVLAAGLLVLAAFCLQQRHEIARGRQPLLDLRLLTRRSLASGLVVQFLFLVPIMGFFLTFMQFLQRGLGMSPLQAGMTMLPWSITVTVFAALSAAVLLPKIGRIAVQLGLVLTAVGLTVISLTATGAGRRRNPPRRTRQRPQDDQRSTAELGNGDQDDDVARCRIHLLGVAKVLLVKRQSQVLVHVFRAVTPALGQHKSPRALHDLADLKKHAAVKPPRERQHFPQLVQVPFPMVGMNDQGIAHHELASGDLRHGFGHGN